MSNGLYIINALTNPKTKEEAEKALELYKIKILSQEELSEFCEGLLKRIKLEVEK